MIGVHGADNGTTDVGGGDTAGPGSVSGGEAG